MERSRVAIVVPALNEEKTISKIISIASIYGQVIVIDDGSNDKTVKFAKKSGAIVKIHKKNLGYDAALNTGFKKAVELNIDYIITLDADGQHHPKLLKKFIDELDLGAGIVLGVRDKMARISKHLFSLYTKYKYGLNDPLCGFKGYNLKQYKFTGYFDTYNSIGTELMLKIISTGKPFRQVCFKVRNRVDKTRFSNSLKINLKILRSLLICMLFKNFKKD